MTEHTPLPWRFDRDWHRLPTIFGADGYKLAIIEKDRLDEAKANADLIIKAVNAFPDLVKALEAFVSAYERQDGDNFTDDMRDAYATATVIIDVKGAPDHG